ncbi:UNVERIFIED_CONTAM: uncharacterized protein DUF3794 [Acetivibrio alkalicellulosi]
MSEYKNYPNYYYFEEKMKHIQSKESNNRNSNPVELNEIIQKRSFQTLVEFELPFPTELPAFKTIDSTTKLDNIKFNIIKGGVIVDGEILKEIRYLSHEGKYIFKYKNEEVNSYYGSIKMISAKIPFSYYAIIDDIKCDDIVEIDCGKEDSEVVDILSKPFICNCCGENIYKSLSEKLIVIINIRVLRKKIVF